jgi:hypothetical protein
MPNSPEPDVVWICLHVEMSSVAGSQNQDYVSVPRTEWDAMTEAEREQWINDAVDAHVANHVSGGGWVVDADDAPPGYENR